MMYLKLLSHSVTMTTDHPKKLPQNLSIQTSHHWSCSPPSNDGWFGQQAGFIGETELRIRKLSEIESCRKPSYHPKSSFLLNQIMIVIYESIILNFQPQKRRMSELFWLSIFPMKSRRGPFKPGDVRANPVGSPWDKPSDDFGKSRVARGISGIGQGIFESFVNLWSQTGVFWCFFWMDFKSCGWYRSDELARAPRGFVGLFMFRTSGKATHVLATNGTKAADTKKWERYTSETNRYGMMLWHDIQIFSMMYEGITKI